MNYLQLLIFAFVMGWLSATIPFSIALLYILEKLKQLKNMRDDDGKKIS